MKTLLLLCVILAAACWVFVVSGAPAIEHMRKAHAELLAREQDLGRAPADLAPVSDESLQALGEDRDRLVQSVTVRLAALTEGGAASGAAPGVTAPSLDDELARSHLQELGPSDALTLAVRAQATTSPSAAAALAAIVHALAGTEGVEVSGLALKNDGSLEPVPGVPQLQQIEAQLVLTAGVPEALSCLELLAPRRGGGLPVLTVMSSSLRRIDPERWGGNVQHFSGPPVRLSVALAVLFSAADGS